jgi:hypothetical protein
MLQSKFFNMLRSDSSDMKVLQTGLDQMFKLSEDVVEALSRDLPRLEACRTPGATQRFVEAQTASLGVARREAGPVVEFLKLLLEVFLLDITAGDTPEALVNDLIDAGLVTKTGRERVLRTVGLLKGEILPEYKRLRRVRQVGSGVLPSFKGVGVTVELRAVLDPAYESGKASPEDYKPELIAWLPIASIAMTTDTDERIGFECDAEALDILLDHLQVARVQLDRIREEAPVPPRAGEAVELAGSTAAREGTASGM